MSAPSKRAELWGCSIAGVLVCLGLTFFTARPAAGAQGTNPPPQEMPFSVTGKIIDHSPGKITISGGENIEFDVKYDSKTEISHADGTPAQDSELKVGITIEVKGTLTEAGDIIARKIVIQGKPGTPPT